MFKNLKERNFSYGLNFLNYLILIKTLIAYIYLNHVFFFCQI